MKARIVLDDTRYESFREPGLVGNSHIEKLNTLIQSLLNFYKSIFAGYSRTPVYN